MRSRSLSGVTLTALAPAWTGWFPRKERMRRLLLTSLLCFACLAVAILPAHAAVRMHRYHSRIYPYSIAYPVGWSHTSGHFTGGFRLFAYDGFVSPKHNAGPPASVVISRLPYAGKETDASLRAGYVAALAAHTRDVHADATVTVVGHRLVLVRYNDSRAHLQAYLARSGQGWIFGLTTVRGALPRWRPIFLAMLRSFQTVPGQ